VGLELNLELLTTHEEAGETALLFLGTQIMPGGWLWGPCVAEEVGQRRRLRLSVGRGWDIARVPRHANLVRVVR